MSHHKGINNCVEGARKALGLKDELNEHIEPLMDTCNEQPLELEVGTSNFIADSAYETGAGSSADGLEGVIDPSGQQQAGEPSDAFGSGGEQGEEPQGYKVDSIGRRYRVDEFGNRLRKINRPPYIPKALWDSISFSTVEGKN